MVNSLSSLSGDILVCAGYLYYGSIVVFFTTLWSHGDVLLVRPLWLRQFFLTFDQLLGAPAKTLFRRFFLNLFLMGSPAGVLLGMPNQLSPLEFLHVWLDAFIWWFGYVMAIPSSDVLMGRLLFQRYFLWISMPPCLHFIVWLVGWQVLNLTLHEINLVQHEWHHL